MDIIFMTDPIPKDAIAAAATLPKDVVEMLTKGFEGVRAGNSECGTAMEAAHIDGFVHAKDSDYDVVRRAISQ